MAPIMVRNISIPTCRDLHQLVNMRRGVCLSFKSIVAHSATIARVVVTELTGRVFGKNKRISVRPDKRYIFAATDFPVDIVFKLFAPALRVVPKNDLPVGADIFFAVACLFNAILPRIRNFPVVPDALLPVQLREPGAQQLVHARLRHALPAQTRNVLVRLPLPPLRLGLLRLLLRLLRLLRGVAGLKAPEVQGRLTGWL